MRTFRTCVEKFLEMKTVCKMSCTVEDFVLFAWIILSDKFFGFTVEVSNYYKLKVEHLKKNKGQASNQFETNTKNDIGTSIVELPRVHYPAEKEYITFGQMMWISTKGDAAIKRWLPLLKDAGSRLEEINFILSRLSHIYQRSNLLRSCKTSLIQYFDYMREFYASVFDQSSIKNFWNTTSSSFLIEPFLFEHAKINELQHDSDGVVNALKTRFILKFNYDKFHKQFSVNQERMVESLMPLLFTRQSKTFVVNYFNSFVSVLKLLTLPHDVIQKDKYSKRIGDVDKVMDLVDAKHAVDAKDLNAGLKTEKTDHSVEVSRPLVSTGAAADKKNKAGFSFDAIFEKNFREVNRLVKNEFGEEASEQRVLLNTDMERLRAGKVIVTNKEDIGFSFDKLAKKKKPIMVKAQVTENLEDAVKYNLQLATFEENLRNLDFDFHIDISRVFSAIQEKHFDGFTRNQEDYDLVYRVDARHSSLKKGDSFAEQNCFSLKIKFRYETIPFEKYDNFVRISCVELRLYYPYLNSYAFLVIKEPCFIIRILRILSLTSEYLRNWELSSLFGRLLSHHHPKNTFASIDIAINSNYHRDEKHFYMTVLRVCDERNLSAPLSRQTKDGMLALKRLKSLGVATGRSSKNSFSPTFSNNAMYSPQLKKFTHISIPMHLREETDEASREAVTSRRYIETQKEEFNKLQERVGLGNKNLMLEDPNSKLNRPMINLQPVMTANSRKQSINSISDVKDYSLPINSPYIAEKPAERGSHRFGFTQEATKALNIGPKKKNFSSNRWECEPKTPMNRLQVEEHEPSVDVESASKTNYDPDGFAYLRQHSIVSSEKQARRRYEKMNNLLETDEDAKITVKKPDEQIMPLDSTKLIQNLDENLKVVRISFKLHDQKELTPTYRFTENSEGFLNTTLQKKINSMKSHVQDLIDLPQEKVKEKLLINDPSNKNCLEGIPGSKSEVFSFIQTVNGLGKCHIKVFAFYSKVDYTKKTVVTDTDRRQDLFSSDFMQDAITAESIYEGLCFRLKTMTLSMPDPDLNPSLRDVSDDNNRIQGFSLDNDVGVPSPYFPGSRVKQDEVFRFNSPEVQARSRIFSPPTTNNLSHLNLKPSQAGALKKNPSLNNTRGIGSSSRLEESKCAATKKLFRKEEILLLNINIVPINFKHREYKVILNSQDINSVFDLKRFFRFSLQSTSASDLEYKLSVVHPKLMFVNLLRYLVSKLEMTKALFYRQPTFKKDAKDNFLLLNVFNKYEHNTNIIQTAFLDKVSNNKVVLFTGVKKCQNAYFVVTIILNVIMNSLTFKVYRPNQTRTFVCEVQANKVTAFAEDFLHRFIFPLFLNGEIRNCFKSYADFSQTLDSLLSSRHRSLRRDIEWNEEPDDPEMDEDRDIDRQIHRQDLDLSNPLDDLSLLGMQFDNQDKSEVSNEPGAFTVLARKVNESLMKVRYQQRFSKSITFVESLADLGFAEKITKVYDAIEDPWLVKLFVIWDRQMTNSTLS